MVMPDKSAMLFASDIFAPEALLMAALLHLHSVQPTTMITAHSKVLIRVSHIMPCRLTTLERKDFILKREPKGPTASTQSTVVDLYPLIIEYITLFQSKWVQWGVQDNVHAFKEKHPTYSPQEVLGTSS